MRVLTVLACGAAFALANAGCGSTGGATDEGRLQVVVGFYPLQYLAERVGGDLVTVDSLAQPGAEPHDLELAPRQVGEVAEAGLVLYLRTLQPAVDDAVAQNAPATSFDVLTATDYSTGYAELGAAAAGAESGIDPHVWLDPTKYADLATAVADRMAEADPGHARTYAGNGAALVADLTRLDQEYTAGLRGCERTEIVTTHNAFGYLAHRYGLEQVGISGLSPDEEPSPQRLDEVGRFAVDSGVTTIFYEDAVSPDYARTVAEQVGASTAVLSPVEVAPDGQDYLSLMRSNLRTLQAALGCQ